MSISIINTATAIALAENLKQAVIVEALDTDGNPVTYSVTGGADAALFEISVSGALSFISAPDFDLPSDSDGDNVYNVEVTATSAAGSVVHPMTVTITSANDALEKSLDFARVAGQKIAEEKVRNDEQDTELGRLEDDKADKVAVNTAIENVNTAIGQKANTDDVNTALDLKANQSDVNTALAAKADSTTVNTALATKADVTALDGVDTRVEAVESKYGPDGKLKREFASDSVMTGQQVIVNTEAEMLALTSAEVQNGDIVIVDTGDEQTQASYWVRDETALSDIASYQKVLTQMDGVFNIVVDGVATNGDVALHKSAVSGKASDQEYTPAASSNIAATTTKGALDELGESLAVVAASINDSTNYDPKGVFETAYAARVAQG